MPSTLRLHVSRNLGGRATGIEKETEGVTLVSTRHRPRQFSIAPRQPPAISIAPLQVMAFAFVACSKPEENEPEVKIEAPKVVEEKPAAAPATAMAAPAASHQIPDRPPEHATPPST